MLVNTPVSVTPVAASDVTVYMGGNSESATSWPEDAQIGGFIYYGI